MYAVCQYTVYEDNPSDRGSNEQERHECEPQQMVLGHRGTRGAGMNLVASLPLAGFINSEARYTTDRLRSALPLSLIRSSGGLV